MVTEKLRTDSAAAGISMDPTPPVSYGFDSRLPRAPAVLTPDLRSITVKRTELLLLKLVRANFNTQYASRTTSLAEFRDAISIHGSGSDTTLTENFRRLVPLSDYESYKPFMSAFNKHPCQEAEVKNLFAPGFPLFLIVSSSTSGRGPKFHPKYECPIPSAFFDSQGSTAAVIFFGYREVKEIEREPGQIVGKIPVTYISAGTARAKMGWVDADDDKSRVSLIMPSLVAPWAASLIKHYKSFLMIHALFTLACRDLDHISTTIAIQLYDLIRHIDEEWEMFLSSIRNGTIPDLPGIHEVQAHLQAHLHANPNRAAELREFGPPFSCEGWAARVWPKLNMMTFVCSGPFGTVLPQVKSIIGPTVTIRTPGYGSSESLIAAPHRPEDLDKFVLQSDDLVEFLDVTMDESHENLRQPWELEAGKQYEIVLTTNDGLWRYRLDDIINVTGFDANDGSPVFMYSGRRSLAVRLVGMLLTETHLMPAIQAVKPDVMQINEFTTVLDERQSTQTVGYFVELAGTLGPNAHLAPMKLAEGLAAANTAFQGSLEAAMVRYPTVRIVKSGTFAEYRQWRAEEMNIGPGQVKVPVVLLNEAFKKWFVERVIGEL